MDYLSYSFNDDETFINTFDELPLWSAYCGILLFKHLPIKRYRAVVDIGSGAGFPLTELAERLGSSCKVYGIDPWTNANKRANQKILNYQLGNVEVVETSADTLPFENNSIDMVVSNLGINNFAKPHLVFEECHRVLLPGGTLALTTNLQGHWREFYVVFYESLEQLGFHHLIPTLKEEEDHRGTVASVAKLFSDHGFQVNRHFEESFEMKFIDGTAFLNHHFVKLGWLVNWVKLFPADQLSEIFTALKENLNKYAMEQKGLSLTVPIMYMEGEKK